MRSPAASRTAAPSPVPAACRCWCRRSTSCPTTHSPCCSTSMAYCCPAAATSTRAATARSRPRNPSTASSPPTTSSTWRWPARRWSSTCRCWRCAAGMQVLNIVLGGTLVQDIGNDEHWMREHSVKLVEGSIVAKLVGDTHLDHCHSVHHQGIGELGSRARADRVRRGWAARGRRAAGRSRGSSGCNGTPKTPPPASRNSRPSTTSSSAERACTDRL